MSHSTSLHKRCLLTASILLGVSFATVPVLASAAPVPSAANSAVHAQQDRFTLAFYDSLTGKTFVNATDASGERYIIFQDNDNKWYKFPKGYNAVWKSTNESLAHIELSADLPGFDSSLWGALLYDETDNTIHYGKTYLLSPNKGYGIREQEDYVVTETGTKRMFSVWLQDRTSGVVREIWRNEERGQYRFHWTNDDRLLTERYNETTKKAEILLYDAAAGDFKPLIDGQLWRLNADKNLLLYIDNSDQRNIWIYDLNTGEKRKSGGVSEEYQLFPFQPLTALPSVDDLKIGQLDAAALPEVVPQFVSTTVAELIYNGSRYPLPHAIVSGTNNFIPVAAIMKQFNLQIDSSVISEASPAKQYTLTHNDKVVQLTPEQIRIHDNRIFISLDVLKEITQASDLQLQWTPPVGLHEEVQSPLTEGTY
ncbi:hypothetical protein [Paenibacillus sp. GCM10027626]|uniref:hypothetical protein n=1 Tax=Paenibacillus sp. GCM10027626 TaxID=3273411 RepID=UPI00364021C0